MPRRSTNCVAGQPLAPDLREDPITPELRYSPVPGPDWLPGPALLGVMAALMMPTLLMITLSPVVIRFIRMFEGS